MDVMLSARRFTVDEYHRMGEAGILRDERVELVEGTVVRMSPVGSRHAAVVARLAAFFGESLGRRALVWIRNPLRLGEDTEVQPDVALLLPAADTYASRIPGPQDARLVVEVADSTVRFDTETKAPLYGSRGIADVWVVRLDIDRIAVFRGGGEPRLFGPGEDLGPLAYSDVRVPIDRILA